MTLFACILLSKILSAAPSSGATPAAQGALAAEIHRWLDRVRDDRSKDETWVAVKGQAAPLLAGADDALRHGRRFLALQRLASARAYLAAGLFERDRSDASAAAFEREWTRAGRSLKEAAGALDGVHPAVARALSEAAISQSRVYYDSSLEYGRNTIPGEGLFYLGLAHAQREFASLAGGLLPRAASADPALRSLEPEIDALETRLLEAYRPPAAIEKHGDFIAASAVLKEARELDAAGRRYGALLKYLQAVQRIAALSPSAPVSSENNVQENLRRLGARLAQSGRDDSIGELFVETAEDDPAKAAVLSAEVLPRYFAALEPAPAVPGKPAPRVTVTLVRWPYT